MLIGEFSILEYGEVGSSEAFRYESELMAGMLRVSGCYC